MLTLSGMSTEGVMAQPGNETDFTEKQWELLGHAAALPNR
jgi:hypothetical protein